jgi:hypothetical protein
MKRLILSILALTCVGFLAVPTSSSSPSEIPHEHLLAKCKCKDGGNKGKS